MGATNLLGRRFGRLVVIARAGNTAAKKARWYCACDCGSTVDVIGGSLRNGQQISCGCYRSEVFAKNFKPKHGHSRRGATTSTYRIWADMLKRTRNPNHWAWKYYGGRGITTCERWWTFENFLADMGERPGKHLTLDRIDNDQGYRRDNCRWATRKQQSQNRRPFSVSKKRRDVVGDDEVRTPGR